MKASSGFRSRTSTGSSRRMFRRLHRGVEQFLDRDSRCPTTRGRRPRRPVPSTAFNDHVHQIVDVDEVAARVHHEALLAVGEAVEEGRQRAAHVPRTVGVGETEGDEVQAAEVDVVFAGGLADRVAASVRPQRMAERDRLFQRVQAVTERGLKVNQACDAWCARRPARRSPCPARCVRASSAQPRGSL